MHEEPIKHRAGDVGEEWMARQQSSLGTMVKVQWWQVMLIFIAVIGALSSILLSHAERITRVETMSTNIEKSLGELKMISQDTNALLHNHIEKDVK